MSDVSTILEQEKQAQLQLRDARYKDIEGIKSWDIEGNDIYSMAQLISKTLKNGSGYYTLEQSFVLALHWKQTTLNPYFGEIYIQESGRLALSVQGELKEAKRLGTKIRDLKFTPVTRDWPKVSGKPYELIHRVDRQNVPFYLDEEPGMICDVVINEQPFQYTAWLTEWHMPANDNWFTRRTHMLMTRAYGNALAFSTGIALSQDMARSEGPEELVEPKVTAPKSVPAVAK